jgi:hypothetical protein
METVVIQLAETEKRGEAKFVQEKKKKTRKKEGILLTRMAPELVPVVSNVFAQFGLQLEVFFLVVRLQETKYKNE